MNLNNSRYLTLLVALFSILYGCQGCLQTRESKIKIELADKEIQLQKDLSNQYNCNVKLKHDDLVVTNQDVNSAVLYVVFRDEDKNIVDLYCKKDTLFLDSISRIIALKVYSTINYRKKYNKIDLIYRGADDCSQLVEVPVKTLN